MFFIIILYTIQDCPKTPPRENTLFKCPKRLPVDKHRLILNNITNE